MYENTEYIIKKDSSGNTLSGERNYTIHLPSGIPAKNFWSVIVYDNESGLMIHTDQSWPSVYSSCKKLIINQDGSVDIWFGPKVPPGREINWIQTIPGKGWYMILRLYEPLESWLNKNWKPGKMEEVK